MSDTKIQVTFYGPEGSTVQGVSKAVAETLHFKEGGRYPSLSFAEKVMALEMYLMLEAMEPEPRQMTSVNTRAGRTTVTAAQGAALGGVRPEQILNQGQLIMLAQLRLCLVNQKIVDQAANQGEGA